MSLQEYRDPYIAEELGGQLGEYEKSFSAQGGLVEIHLFRTASGEQVAFLVKSQSIPLRIAQDLARAAFSNIGLIEGRPPRIILDADSLPRTGSI